MARSLSQSKPILLSLLLRRGLAVSASVPHHPLKVGKLEDTSAAAKQGSSEEASSAWGPDPVTGYYRPINHSPQIDPAELRLMLLNHHPLISTSNST